MRYQVGTMLRIGNLDGVVIGFIEYKNPEDKGNRWTEYRLSTSSGEKWLSCDEVYNEYSISEPANYVKGKIGPEWHEVDRGHQVVTASGGDVDVDYGESARFVEYEDEEEEKTLSVEIWSDGTEYSTGYYVDKEEITVTGMKKMTTPAGRKAIIYLVCLLVFIVGSNLFSILGNIHLGTSISKYLKKSSLYTYETSITGNEKQKADVYSYFMDCMTDDVAKELITAIDGDTESVTQKDNEADAEIAILTKKEYCLVYHPDDNPNKVYVQVSDRKYNYTSDNSPYKLNDSGSKWYRAHYYSSGFAADSSSFSKTPSAYQSYSGDTVHNIGNGYFDSYAGSVRQNSINSRNSSGGGLSSGK